MSMLSKTSIPTPLGNMIAIASAAGLAMLMFEEKTKAGAKAIENKIAKQYPHHTFCDQFYQPLNITTRWLKDYFSKNFAKLKHLPPLDMHGTPFAKTAWQALLQIPAGSTQSYGALAKDIGFPKASRAIGRVMGQNPITILVPCHRIIGSQGTLTGYGGGLERKKWLLEHETGSLPLRIAKGRND